LFFFLESFIPAINLFCIYLILYQQLKKKLRDTMFKKLQRMPSLPVSKCSFRHQKYQ
jgi:hypothetical protein